MLKLPVYLRETTYYLHTRIAGKQFKKSLHTSCPHTAKIRALELLKALAMTMDPSKIRKYNIDVGNGVFKADGPDDHARMMEALTQMGNLGLLANNAPTKSKPAPTLHTEPPAVSMRMGQLITKLLEHKKHLKPATVVAYKNTVTEFAKFIGNPQIHTIHDADISRYQDHLAVNNTARTIDNKIGILRTVFNFAIKAKVYFLTNPAADRNLLIKQDKKKGGYAHFHPLELERIFLPNYLAEFRKKDPDFYLCIVIGLITGCRISEITSLDASNIFQKPVPHIYITDAKTPSGVRMVPIPQCIYDEIKLLTPTKGKLFKYVERLGKGSGGAVSQKFKRHMDKVEVLKPKLCFHSLRKQWNQYMFNAEVPIEYRCQLVGHELNNVNVEIYLQHIEIKKMANMIVKIQESLLDEMRFQRPESVS